MAPQVEKLTIPNAQLIFKNFSGQPGQFNRDGKRDFCVVLSQEQAAQLKEEGWNVRTLPGRAEGEDPTPYMNVAVSYDNFPPTITLVTSKKKNMLKLDDIGILDFAEIKHVDLVINPYHWEVDDKKGIKAYLKTLYVVIEEDEFAEKYSDIPGEVPA